MTKVDLIYKDQLFAEFHKLGKLKYKKYNTRTQNGWSTEKRLKTVIGNKELSTQ